MAPIAISFLAFALALIGILLGSILQRMLPEGHHSSDSKEVVKLSMGVVATLAALVLGLLVASAKSTYDARESEINQITAYVILLDNLLAKYGEEAQAARASLREAIPAVVDRIWREAKSVPLQTTPFKTVAEGEAVYQRIQELQPSNDIQRGLQARIIQITNDLMQSRFLLYSHLGSSIQVPFLAVLLLWMIILFAGFSLMAPANATTLLSLVICALSVSGASSARIRYRSGPADAMRRFLRAGSRRRAFRRRAAWRSPGARSRRRDRLPGRGPPA